MSNLEPNNLYLGDCLELMKLIPDKSIHAIICDLPFGITARNKWDVIIPFVPLWDNYERVIKDNGIIILNAVQPFTSSLVLSNPKLFKYSLVWKKTTPTGFLNAKKMPLRTHEDILVFYKSPPIYNPQKTTGHKRKTSKAEHKKDCINTTNYSEHGLTTYDSTERYPTSVLEFSTDKQKSSLHPTQKPIKLCEYLIKTYTNEGDLVLDNCMGSGTTCLAAKNLNRRYIGIDSEEKYYNIAKERLK